MTRGLVAALVLCLVAPLAVVAQPAAKIARIGVLANTPTIAIGGIPADPAAQRLGEAVLGRLRELGWVEGRNLFLEYRFVQGRPERLPTFAAELVNLDVDVIIVNVNRAAMAVQRLTTRIPVVMLIAEDPVGAGLVQSLAHPGGNITGLVGVIDSDIVGKNLEFLEMMLPRGASVGLLHNPTSPTSRHYLKGWEEAVRNLTMKLVPAPAANVEELEHAFLLMKHAHARGVVITGDPLFYANRRRVNELAVRHGLAASWLYREGPDAGGLMSYGASLPALARRAATYVDKILRGAKPGDLAMEQPTTFELILNAKTAAVLGVTVPEPLLRLADEVIR